MDAQLKNKGWFLTNEGLDLCKEGLVNPSVDTLIQRALDIDLRLLSSGSHDDANTGKTDAVQGPLILQIQKIRNVASPKLNEESNYAPKLLRILLTDGSSSTYSGLLLYTIPKIDMNTTPGTKLLITGRLLLKQGLMLLDQNNTKVLGGYVDEMVERWKLIKSLSQFTRATKVEGAPPPWVPFGQRKNMASTHRNDHSGKGKKSLEGNQKDLTETDKAFEEQRKAAIQEVGKHQSKKFGGGKAVPSNMDRMKESRKSYDEKQETKISGPPPNKANTTQAIYRSLSSDSNKPDEMEIQILCSMGFGRDASITALMTSNGNVDVAVDSLLGGGAGGVASTEGDDRGSRFRDDHQGGFRGSGRNYDSRGGGRGSDSRRGGRGSDARQGGRNFDSSRGRGRGSDNTRRRGDEQDDEYPSQPTLGTTLFDFLESKLGKDSNKDDAFSVPSSSGNQRPRNYAKEQPNSVRESGIKFVHGAGREREESRRAGAGGGRYDKGTKDEPPAPRYDKGTKDEPPAPRSNQSDNPKGSQNDRKTNPRRTDTRPPIDRGASRPRQDKGTAQTNQRSNQYTLPPRFQKLQEVESKKETPGRQEDGEKAGEQRREDGSRKSQREPTALHMNGKHNQAPHNQAPHNQAPHNQGPQRGTGRFRAQQRPQQNPGYERSQPEEGNIVHWNVGDICVAKYWEDNGFYNVTITAIHPTGKTCVVHFLEYGNQEEVLVSDMHPLPNQPWGGMPPPPPQQFPPPNHMMIPQPYLDARNSYNRGSQQRFNPEHGNNNFYQGGRR